MNLQEFYRQEYRRLNHAWKDSVTLYKEAIDREVTASTRLLNVGCGHSEALSAIYAKTPHTYGIDPDPAALEKNRVLKHKVEGTAEDMPFDDNFFDVIISEWVLEHLPDPAATFREIHRVLKPGGKVIFLTPNAWNYNVWMIRMVPHRFHEFFTMLLYGRQKGDTYPVQYKINSPGRIERVLGPLGFKKQELILNGDPSYISFNKPLFYFACALEKLLNLRVLRKAKVHLIGVYQK